MKAQLTQTLRGIVKDQVLQKPLEGATVTVTGSEQPVVTGSGGVFRFTAVAVGLRQVVVTCVGYNDIVIDNIAVSAGKETVMNIDMERSVELQREVEVVAKSRKNRPLNDMSMVSARAFSVEETQKYAAAVNDPLRMTTSFAGVVSADDGNNEIVIRGNAPTGLLWRMEGVDIPNPNHFSVAGTSGGGVSILSSQLLSNSDFVTGAFSAEYGNALSGVFDLKLRKGNNEKREYTVQAGLLGLNLAAEGPFARGYKGSYLVNYRYSTLQLLHKLGIDLAGGGVTNFQDLSFNIYLPTKGIGEFTLFGFGGLSSQEQTIEKDSSKWESEGDRYGGSFKANTGAAGATHSIHAGERTFIKSSLAYSHTENAENELYYEHSDELLNTHHNTYTTRKLILSSVVNHQFDARHVVRAGTIVSRLYFDYYQKSRENPGMPVEERINMSDATQTVQAFAQWQFRPVRRLTLSGGLHYLTLRLNNSSSLEPRASVKYEPDRKNALAFGFGMHSQVQALGVYFAKTTGEAGETVQPNRNLGFTRSAHYVLSYGHSFNSKLRFKTELYYQRLSGVPVSMYDSITFSTLNITGDYVTDPLVNNGTGRNYGIDFSLERHLGNNIYFLLNHSFYEAKYRAADGRERNTRFNGNFVSNFTGGKEFLLNEGRREIGVNMKMILAGGFRRTPIDAAASAEKGYTVFIEEDAFSLQNPAYFRTDLRLSMKWNREGRTSTLSLDVQNLTNRLNLYNQYFDPHKNEVVNNYQTGLIPVLNYKLDF